jgi:hypothetical protein
MKMKADSDDVFLNDGEGYMVEWPPYKKHLDESVELTQVGPSCSAVLNASHQYIIRQLPVPTTRLSHRQMQTEKTLMPQALVPVHVLAMDASFLTL